MTPCCHAIIFLLGLFICTFIFIVILICNFDYAKSVIRPLLVHIQTYLHVKTFKNRTYATTRTNPRIMLASQKRCLVILKNFEQNNCIVCFLNPALTCSSCELASCLSLEVKFHFSSYCIFIFYCD